MHRSFKIKPDWLEEFSDSRGYKKTCQSHDQTPGQAKKRLLLNNFEGNNLLSSA